MPLFSGPPLNNPDSVQLHRVDCVLCRSTRGSVTVDLGRMVTLLVTLGCHQEEWRAQRVTAKWITYAQLNMPWRMHQRSKPSRSILLNRLGTLLCAPGNTANVHTAEKRRIYSTFSVMPVCEAFTSSKRTAKPPLDRKHSITTLLHWTALV